MRRGDIWLFDLDPAQWDPTEGDPGKRTEASKVRPAIIVSNDGANISASRSGTGVVTVVPLTSNVSPVLSFQVKLTPSQTGLNDDSKVQTEQVRAVSVTRARTRLGGVRDSDMADVDRALRQHLAL